MKIICKYCGKEMDAVSKLKTTCFECKRKRRNARNKVNNLKRKKKV